ncbi:MAG: hypothetical protein WC008_00435 [Bacilli bacterium]
MNLWKKGKIEMHKYYELKLRKSTDIKSMIFGLILTVVLVIPVAFLLIDILEMLYYHPLLSRLLIIVAWILLMLCNGLSNLFMIKLAKRYYPENPNLTNIDEKSIFVYQSFNIGFGLFTLAIMIFLGVL